MQDTRLGTQGPTVSRMGLGTAALGRPGYINLGHGEDLAGHRSPELLERHAHAVFDHAVAAGVSYLDAARSYGWAEDFIASWLTGRDRPAPVVGSKWGYRYVADGRVDAEVHEVKELSLAHLETQLAETNERLGSHLRLYQIHSATLDSGVLTDAGVLARLRTLRETGVLVGLTTTGPRQGDTIDAALDIDHEGRPLFATVQTTWNPLEPSAGPALARAHAAGLGVIVKEAVANGRLTPRGDAGRRIGRDADARAIATALAQPWCSVVLSGASTTAQLDANLLAFDVDPVDDESLREEPEAYWSRRGDLAWT